MLTNIGHTQEKPIILYYDLESRIRLAVSPKFYSCIKNIDIKYHMI